MSVINKTNKNYKRSQKGRSMVEMLGVLAIIGVLSVGGLYGYGVAMKKHKANELLHQASMLAATISAQAMTNNGTLPQTITDFGNTSYGKFQSDVGETADKTGFTITISELDGSVCSQLKEGGMVQGVECKDGTSEGKMNAEITYYKNLATDPAEGEKSPTGGNSVASCKSDIVKVYNCETKTTTDCCPDTETCTQPTNCGCASDDDCPGDQICNDDKVCDCPGEEWGIENELGLDGKTCCRDGIGAWDGEWYNGVNIEACGCPHDGEKIGDTCCADNGEEYFIPDGWYPPEVPGVCGCPYGGKLGSDGVTCCKNGDIWMGKDPNDWLDNDYYSPDEPGVCGCPKGGEKIGDTCCLNGNEWMDGDYYDNGIGVCGCPEGGTKVGEYCCLDNYLYSDGGGYVATDPTICGGCPEGGENIDGTCCKNGLEWSAGYISYSLATPTGCGGCPNGGTASEIYEWECCKDGKAWSPYDLDYTLEEDYCS